MAFRAGRAGIRRDRLGPTPPASLSLARAALLIALIALGQISTSIYVPSLPSLVDAFSTSPARANLTLSLFLLGFAAGQLLFGPLSDRFGRRTVLVAGLACYAAASVACASASSIEGLVAARVVQGFTASVGPVLGRALVRDIYGPERSAGVMGYIGAGFAISPAVSPMIGGFLHIWFGWRAAFIVLAGVGLIVLLASRRMIEGSGPALGSARITELFSAWRAVATDRSFWARTLAVALMFAGLMAFTAAAPFVFIGVLGLTPDRFGLLYVFPVMGFFAGSLAAGRLASVIAGDRLLRAGLAAGVAGSAAMALLATAGQTSVIILLASMALFSGGLGLVMATGTAGALARFPHVAGAASALLGCAQMIAGAVASFVVGALPQTSALPMAAILAILSAAALAAFTFLGRAPTELLR